MELVKWINKNIAEIQGSFLYGKYFDTIHPEKGIDVYYLLNPFLGIDLILTEENIIKSIHFYLGDQSGTNRFPDTLPFGLDFSFSRKKVRSLLGDPQASGGGEPSVLYGISPDWDRFMFDTYYMNVQYISNNELIGLVTLGSFGLR